jgi:hypothetical protein
MRYWGMSNGQKREIWLPMTQIIKTKYQYKDYAILSINFELFCSNDSEWLEIVASELLATVNIIKLTKA